MSDQSQGGLIIFTIEALITPPAGERVRDYHRWQVLPDRNWKLRQLHLETQIIVVVSNQDLVAFGCVDDSDYQQKVERLQDLLGVALDYRVCYAHPDALKSEFRDPNGLARRLPGAAMLVDLMLAHPVEMQLGTLFVSLPEDAAAARAAGIDFMSAPKFFGELPCLVSHIGTQSIRLLVRLLIALRKEHQCQPLAVPA